MAADHTEVGTPDGATAGDPSAAPDDGGVIAETAVGDILREERDIQQALGDRPLDFMSHAAVANIYRAASAIRRRAERTVLADANLTWGGFTVVWVLWVWGEMETYQLAEETALTKGTITGLCTTLEKRGLIERERLAEDRRRVQVRLTETGLATIEDLYPRYNSLETEMVSVLADGEKREMARLLRAVTLKAQ